MVVVNPEDRPYLRFLWPGRSDTSFHIDDLISRVSNAPEAKKIQEFSVRVLTEAGMEFRMWRGNELPMRSRGWRESPQAEMEIQ